MTVQEFEIKNKIVSFLRRHETGASASDIAKSINHNRITIGKYLQVLRAEQIVVSKKVASALYWQLADFSRKFKILIVDDEKNIVDLVRLSLTSGRYDIYEAYDGLEAMNMIQKIIPDLIVLDLMMPIMDGLTVCKQLKSNVLTRSIPIIILSAKGEIKEKMQLLEIGVDDYITKPFNFSEVLARIRAALRGHKLYDQMKMKQQKVDRAEHMNSTVLGFLDRLKEALQKIKESAEGELNGKSRDEDTFAELVWAEADRASGMITDLEQQIDQLKKEEPSILDDEAALEELDSRLREHFIQLQENEESMKEVQE